MNSKTTTPDYLFESSWEVCNKVGGIYTVLSTKARTLQQSFQDRVIFIGPDVWGEAGSPDFIPDDVLYADWAAHAQGVEQLKIKVGRWSRRKMHSIMRCGRILAWIRFMRMAIMTSRVCLHTP